MLLLISALPLVDLALNGLRFLSPSSRALFGWLNPGPFLAEQRGLGGFHAMEHAPPESLVPGNCSPGPSPGQADEPGGGERG